MRAMQRFHVILVLLAVSLGVGVDHPMAAEPMDLNVVTFNVLVDLGKSGDVPIWKNRRELCVEVLREVDPDLIGLQEPLPRQVEYILDQMSDYAAVHDPDGFTDATLLYRTSRFEKLEEGQWWLSPTPEKRSTGFGNFLPRLLVWVKLKEKDSGRELYFFNTHFDNSRPSQTKMAELCEQKMKPFMKSGLPLIFVGDFNTDQNRGDYPRLTSNGWRDAYVVSKYASGDGRDDNITTFRGSQKRIDHIFFYGEGITPLEWERLESPDPEVPLSDHFPVFARLRIE